MTNAEMKQANALHAVWDVIVMHYSLESALDTHNVSIADVENIYYKLREKLDAMNMQCSFYW